MVPILKKGKRSLANNYRPLSLTSVTSKTLEHIICHHIWKHLEDHNVLSNFQHGFCKWRNCETQLIMAIHDLVSAMNSKKQVDTLIWDFTKAVDRVPHQGLLYKLGHYGIQGSFFPWIQVFLTKRTERVALKGVLSNQCFVTSGVPQGMVLGPLQFLTCPYVFHQQWDMFVDDCFLYHSINNPVDCQNIQKDLDTLTKWEKDWQMSFNVDKCLTICFSTKKSNLDTTYVLNNHVLTQVHHHSYLGMILSEDLKWSEHNCA